MAARKKKSESKPAERRWRILRLRGTPAAELGVVYAPDAETAIKLAIEEFKVPENLRDRLMAQAAD